VLTPITAYRMHPVDDSLSALCSGVLSGIVAGAFQFADPTRAGALTLLGVNACFFLFYAAGFNLRHSHIWLSYGALFDRIFISPAQHQVHHSVAERHWHRNYGFMLAFWDGLAGTLYVPRGYEEIAYGLPDGEGVAYDSLPALYALPFRRVFRQRL
jgi:sterol desaturase/sphingolipid hydroxylase (fatty acid hydroxylase superfamily)